MKRRLTTAGFESYLAGRGLPEGGEAICRRSWVAPGPGRRVRSSRFHGSARLASTKTGSTRDTGSLLEYSVYRLFEYRQDVLWYLAQPADQVQREFVTVAEDGQLRVSSAWATLDAFVLWADATPGWVDIKPLAKVHEQNEAHPGFYVFEDGAWRCPSADAYVARFGLSHTVIVDRDLNATEVANADYLGDFLDIEPDSSIIDRLRECVARRPGITIAALRDAGFPVEQVGPAIYAGEVFVDLTKHQLRQQDLAFVYLNPTVAKAMPAPVVVAVGGKRPGPVHVAVGEEVIWNGHHYVIDGTGPDTVGMAAMDGLGDRVDLSSSELERAMRSGAMIGLGPVDAEARARIELLAARYASADEAATERACERLAALTAYWAGERSSFPYVDGQPPSLAAVRLWQTHYREMEEAGCGFAGLLDRPMAGRPGSHLPAPTQDLLAEVGASFYNTPGRLPSVAAFHKVVSARASSAGILAPSYPAVLLWTKRQPQYEQKRLRQGHKGAADIKPWAPLDPMSAPPNGQYPGHVTHGDATVADIWVVERFTGSGSLRPSLWRLVDGQTGKRLGRAWHFGEVDEGTVLEALADQIRTHGFLSSVYVLDSALVHKTTRVQILLSKYGSNIIYRKGSDGRSGLPVERDFGRINTDTFNALRGNTQISKNVRAMDPALDPRRHALWPLRELIAAVDARDALVERERVIDGLRMTTAAAWSKRFEHGIREAHLVRWSSEVERAFAVRHAYQPRIKATTGIWVNRIYYWNEVFLHPALLNRRVSVRTIRSDIGRVWAFVPGHTADGVNHPGAWLECVCRSPIARERVSYEELAFFTKVLLAFNAEHYGRKQVENGALGRYLCGLLDKEAELLEEREATRARSGHARGKASDLPRGDVLADAPEPEPAVVTEPTLTVLEGGACAPVSRASARVRSTAITFGTGARKRENDFARVPDEPLA